MENASRVVAVREQVFSAKPADNFVAHISSNALCALIPEDDLQFAVDQIHARVQTVENVLKDFRIVQSRHAVAPLVLSAGMGKRLGGRSQLSALSF